MNFTKLSEFLESDMGEVIDWLEANAGDYILVPKKLLQVEDYGMTLEDSVLDNVDAIENGAPRGEILDNMDFNEDMLFTLSKIIALGEKV